MAGNTALRRRRAGAVLALAAGLLSGCGGMGLPSDPEARAVRILTDRGFSVLSDGRGGPGVTLMTYTGPTGALIECSRDGTAFATAGQDLEWDIPDRPFDGRQRGTVSANVSVGNDGKVSGLYVNAIKREYIAGGAVLGSETEVLEMQPGETKRLSNGLLCRPKL